MKPGPLWILSWDAAAPWLLERALQAGATPNLARLRRRGVSAAGSVSDYPDCTTPPGHAVLWTGHPASRNGVTSFRIPAPPDGEHTVLQWSPGFDARLLEREPLWVAAAQAGRSVTLCHVPLSTPLDPWLEGGRYELPDPSRLTVFHGYGNLRADCAVARDPELRPARGWKGVPHDLEGALEFQFRAKPLSLPVLLLRGPSGALDRAWVAPERHRGAEGVLVEAGPEAPFSAPMELGERAGLSFRLFELAPDGSRLLLMRTAAFGLEAHPAPAASGYRERAGPFAGWGPYRLYGDGSLGERYRDGVAEARYMQGHRFAMEHFQAATRHALAEHPADLMIFYHPGIDELGHLWLSHVQEGEPWFDPTRHEQVWEHFLTAHRLADEHLGILLEALPEDGTLLLVSDHGMGGIRRHFLPNVLLQEAGLLHTMRGNPYKIDAARTRALYHPANNGYVFVNHTGYRHGCVAADEVEEVLEAAREALAAYQDPDSGKPVLAGVIRADQQPEDSDLRGRGRGELFLVLKPGYSLGDSLHTRALLPADLAGHHQQHPGVRAMHGVFEATGPRLRRDHRIGVLQHRDVHETARALLGLPGTDGGGEVATTALLPEDD